MSLNEDLRNCRIVIRDTDTEQTIADTTILTYDAETGRVEIEFDGAGLPEQTVISALIFSAAGLFESHGTVGVQAEGKTEIFLYEGAGRNDRQAVRYQVHIVGEVDQIVRPEEGKLPGGFEVTVLNMSSIGLLLLSPKGKVQMGDTIRFSAVTKGQRIVITVEATRVEPMKGGSGDMERVGCSIRLVNFG
ncbi:MAG: hypothetical protein NC399_09650 [Muribaculum sp.]|nr:hypothetical protein [Muribaculum sp.]